MVKFWKEKMEAAPERTTQASCFRWDASQRSKCCLSDLSKKPYKHKLCGHYILRTLYNYIRHEYTFVGCFRTKISQIPNL